MIQQPPSLAYTGPGSDTYRGESHTVECVEFRPNISHQTVLAYLSGRESCVLSEMLNRVADW